MNDSDILIGGGTDIPALLHKYAAMRIGCDFSGAKKVTVLNLDQGSLFAYCLSLA